MIFPHKKLEINSINLEENKTILEKVIQGNQNDPYCIKLDEAIRISLPIESIIIH